MMCPGGTMKRLLAAIIGISLVTLVTACGQQVAGTSTTAASVSMARSAVALSSAKGPASPTVSATAAATRTVTAAPPVTVTATPSGPETVTQTPPPVVVVPAPRVTVTQVPSTVYLPRGSSAADDQVASDRLTAEVMVDSWIPQLSSNPDSASAMAKYRTLSARYGGVFMVASDAFSSFRNPGYYVTLVAYPFGTPAEANAWCDASGFPAGDCLAKKLSHTDGPDGSTVERG